MGMTTAIDTRKLTSRYARSQYRLMVACRNSALAAEQTGHHEFAAEKHGLADEIEARLLRTAR